jgi:AraC-like DNA-binding protein
MVNNNSNAATADDKFIEQPTKKVIDQATRELIDRLLLERISLAGIARAAQVSEQWLQTYVNEKYANVPRQMQVTQKKGETDNSMR